MKRILLVLVCVTLPLYAQEVLRGEVAIDLEEVRGFFVEENRVLNLDEAKKAGVETAARYFGAMIYGWSFHYDVGERARNIEEKLELTPLGIIGADDPRMEVTDIQTDGSVVHLWVDYRPEETQLFRLGKWKAGTIRTAQGYGESPLEDKDAALEDAARAAIRGVLRGNERNRPKEASGFISLAAFPRDWLGKGRWAAYARFRIDIREIIPFAAH